MKTTIVSGAVLVVFALGILAQPAISGFGGDGKIGDGYSIKERGPHHRIWERREIETTPMGTQVERKLSYTELATGMHYLGDDGQWAESREAIEILPKGAGAAAQYGQHKVIFPADIYDGAVQMQLPDGQWLRSRILGLSYYDLDSGKSVLIAETTNSIGELHGSNVVIYPEVFPDFRASVRLTYTRAGFEQDIILLSQPPSCTEWGMNPKTTKLQVLTEFFDPPTPVKREATVTDSQGAEQPDEILSFPGDMQMGAGRAFSLEPSVTGRDIPVTKRWTRLEGRDFLIEEIGIGELEMELEALPKGASLPSGTKAERQARLGWPTLPARRQAQVTGKAMRMAKAPSSGKGFVLDYTITLASATNLTFQSDTTYFLSGAVYGYGTNIFEGGSVLKFATNGTLQLIPGPPGTGNPRVVWQGAAYRPVIFTAKDDNSVGETISGSTGSPSGYYGNPMLFLATPAATPTLSGLRMASGKTGIQLNGASANFYDAQFINCENGLNLGGGMILLGNALFSGVKTNFVFGGGSTLSVQNATFDTAIYLATAPAAPTGCNLSLTNCVLARVTNFTAGTYYSINGGWNGFYNSLGGSSFGASPISVASYPFQTIGGGAHYLAADSLCRNAGTTNVDATLLTELAAKTTYPPLAYTNTTFPGYDTFYPMAQRDSDAPDLGYHYDPLDYLVGRVDVNVNTTFAPGTAVGWFRYDQGWYHAGHGLHVADANTLTFAGQADSPCYFVHQTAVQENRIGFTTIDAGPGGITGWATTKANRPFLNLQFTRCAGLPIYRNYFRDDYGGIFVSANHSEFYGGGLGGYVSDAGFTNCLLDRTFVWLEAGNTNYADVFAFRNCTVRGGTFSINRQSSNDGRIQTTVLDTAFESTAISTSDAYAGNASLTRYDYNAYLTNASRTYPNGTHDVLVNTFNWQHGWLGDFYLPAGSSLINTGSVTDAASVGLYHFTTVTNQVKETNSTVDIGYHYVALDTNNVPVDTDTGGVADYLEDPNGSGTVNGGETDWTSGHGGDDKDHKVNKHLLTPGYLRCEYRVDPWGVDAKDPWTGQQKPRLYWIVTSQRRAAKQVAYRILVASSPENLNANIGDMWDSGRVCSDQTIHVEYDPTQHQLQSGQRLWWKVRTWELFSGKASPWSTNAFFQMGLLSTNDLSGAKWIGVNGYNWQYACPMYRSPVFVLTNQLKNATAYVSAKGVYELWINGQKIGPNVLAPEWTDYNQRIQYQTFDVTTNLFSGTTNSANVIGAFTAEGWWKAGNGIWYGTPSPQFFFHLVITNADSTNSIVIDSGTDWSCSTNGPIRWAGIFKGETYEATREGASTNWTLASYSPQYFTAPIAVSNVVASQMFAQPNDPIQVVQVLSAKEMWVAASDASRVITVFDLGQNMVGWSALLLTNVAGLTNTVIYVDHGEALQISGTGFQWPFGPNNHSRVYLENLGGAAPQRETYTLDGQFHQQFRPHFTYHGFRYVQVIAPPSVATNLSLGSVSGWVLRSGVPITGSFWCSDARSCIFGDNLVSRLMTNSFWSMQGNLQGVFTACTQRDEREGYLFDEHVFAQTACYFGDMSAFLTKWIRDIREAQQARGDGGYAMLAPWDGQPLMNGSGGIFSTDPGCQVAGVVFPWRMYQNYADTRMLAEHYASSQQWFGFLADICTNNSGSWIAESWGYISPKRSISVTDWMQGDHYRIWGTAPADWWGNETTMPAATSTWETWCTSWSAYSADTLASMSSVLRADALSKGDSTRANYYSGFQSYYGDMAATIRDDYYDQIVETDANGNVETFLSTYNTPPAQAWHSKSQGDCVSVLAFDMIPTAQRPWVLTNMLLGAASTGGAYGISNYNNYCTGSSKSSNHWSTGYALTSLGMQELTRGGFTTNAYQLLLTEEFPSWLYMVTNGSTTWWEGWNTYIAGVGVNGNSSFRSFNHLPFGSVAEWIWKVMVGINVDARQPGYQNVIVKPEQGGGITNTFGSFNSIHGPIVISWTNNTAASTFSLDATVPANATASIYIPSTNNLANITESGVSAATASGVKTWYVTNPPSYTAGATVFEVGSGSYRFNLTGN